MHFCAGPVAPLPSTVVRASPRDTGGIRQVHYPGKVHRSGPPLPTCRPGCRILDRGFTGRTRPHRGPVSTPVNHPGTARCRPPWARCGASYRVDGTGRGPATDGVRGDAVSATLNCPPRTQLWVLDCGRPADRCGLRGWRAEREGFSCLEFLLARAWTGMCCPPTRRAC
jgi:hypothetical protein